MSDMTLIEMTERGIAAAYNITPLITRRDAHRYNVYANLRDGNGMTLMTPEQPLSRSKADAMADRLVRGKTNASKTLMVKV